MPTPVSSARQCLTDEAAHALDDAVAVARRRGHAQTTSLHAVSALLALSSSLIRDACARARSSAYSPRLQFRALELSVGVSLDRLPSSKSAEEPPVSNSLMAAIRRSQANQRRHPDSFHLYQLQIQQQQSTASLSIIKVELKHLVLSILDDPIVSKVFGEAGFRSYDIKLAILNPPAPPLARFSSSRFPSPFIGNRPWGDSCSGTRGFTFPFSVSSSGPVDGDGNCRRIGEVLVKKTGKNPLLIGASVSAALNSFVDSVHEGKTGVLPAQISGLKLICIEKEVSEFVAEDGNEQKLALKLKQLDTVMAEHRSGPGLLISFGELGVLVGDGSSCDALNHVVTKLTDLLKLHGDKLWLIGAAESYEIYSKFLSRFPSIDKLWDLHLLPVSSSFTAAFEELYPKSSLMGSFVPLGGFFSAPSDFQNPLNSVIQPGNRCHQCNAKNDQEVSAILKQDAKNDQEVSAILKQGSRFSVSDQYSATLPSWLQMEPDANKSVNAMKDEDGAQTLNTKIQAVQKKWTDTCQRLHFTNTFSSLSCSQTGPQVPHVEDIQSVGDGSQRSSATLNEDQHMLANDHATPIQLMGNFLSKQKMPAQVLQPKKTNFLTQPQPEMALERQQPNISLLPCHVVSLPVASVTTELQLGLQYDASTSQQQPRSTDSERQPDPDDFKILRKSLSEKVGRQDEAVYSISQAVSLCRTSNGRCHGSMFKRGIWLGFLGPDKLGKKRIALALAEVIFGSSRSSISVDLGSQYGFSQPDSVFHHDLLSHYDVNFRGKTVVDYIAGELRGNPCSVVFLENIEKADMQVQDSLSRAVSIGKFPDSHGREVGINGAIFVTASSFSETDSRLLPEKKTYHEFSEERILGAKNRQMQILVGSVAGDLESTSPIWELRKRKLLDPSDLKDPKRVDLTAKSFLDLNLPVTETQEEEAVRNSETPDAWLMDFYCKVDRKVVLVPFDFDGLARKVVKEINSSFQKMVGGDAVLEIDPEVMVQILAAAWLVDGKGAVEDWVEQVLGPSFVEAWRRYGGSMARPLLRLVACEGLLSGEDIAPGIRLPARVRVDQN